ncbi:MAG: DEAD/DEAH box helicase [Mangrovibacterium sp.]
MDPVLYQSDVLSLIHPGLQKLIHEEGWKAGLTEIQKKAIPSILNGENCIIEAPTAGGKTEAVFFPCLTKAANNKSESVQVLYIAPLRALLNDIERRAEKYSAACGLHYFKWHGDVGQEEKINAIKNPPNVLLTTPESLEAIMLRKPNWHEFFKDLQSIIIDEAHNFTPVDRGCHLITLIERLVYKIKVSPQRIAITATVGNPYDMLKWLTGSSQGKNTRIFVESAQKKEKDFQLLFFNDRQGATGSELPASYLRLACLYDLLQRKKSIVFGGSRTNCESIATAINKLNSLKKRSIPVKVRTHHSSVSKFYREEAEAKIRARNDLEGGIDSIISTSTLELGIDIGELDRIFQLNAISGSGSFLQRVGRTGRRSGQPQYFRGLLLEEDELVLLTGAVSLGLKGVSESLFFPRKSFHILTHQLICLCLQSYGVARKTAWDILSRSYCFSQITENQFHELVDYMISNGFLRDVEGELVTGDQAEKYYLGANYQKLFAVFSTGPLYEVFNEKNHVGNMDCAFVESMEVPFLFVLGGLEWEAYKIKAETHQVFARKTKAGNAPRWNTFHGADVPFETAKEVGNVLFSHHVPPFLNPEAEACFQSVQSRMRHLDWNDGKWIMVQGDHGSELLTFSGDRINRTLAKLIGIYGLGKASSNYKSVIIKPFDSDSKVNVDSLIAFISDLKHKSTEGLFLRKLDENTSPVFFSKFGKCLPDHLTATTLAERSYNFQGLIDELNKNQIEIFST